MQAAVTLSTDDIYSSGWVDAQLITEGVVPALVRLIRKGGDVYAQEASFDHRSGLSPPAAASHHPLEMPLEVLIEASAALQALCRHPQNRAHVLRDNGVPALVALLRMAALNLPGQSNIAEHVIGSLLLLTQVTPQTAQYGIGASTSDAMDHSDPVSVMVDRGVLPALARVATMDMGADAVSVRSAEGGEGVVWSPCAGGNQPSLRTPHRIGPPLPFLPRAPVALG